MKTSRRPYFTGRIVLAVAMMLSMGIITVAGADAIDCLQCHPDYNQGKFVHAAVAMGCEICHIGLDASKMPHGIQNNIPMGLPSETVADVCIACHDKSKYWTGKNANVHAPVAIGSCNMCHNSHRSENEKLLTAEKKTICFNCHEKDKFLKKKSIHAPVAAGMCRDCHVAHGNNNEALVINKGNMLCRKCHPRIEKEPHAVSGFKQGGHPVRGKFDPKRKGKTFECLSCHVPHSSDWGKLFRYQAESMYDMCIYCHNI